MLVGMGMFLITPTNAEYRDDDGQLGLSLNEPTTGNPLSHYLVEYNVNGDSTIVREIPRDPSGGEVIDSTVVLLDKGQWCVASVRAISVVISSVQDTSSVVVSDTAFYADPTGIGPPTVMWK